MSNKIITLSGAANEVLYALFFRGALLSGDLPPKFLRRHPRKSKNPLFSKHIVNHSSVTVR
ncbi:hypothetical protein ACV8VI_00005 [Citrobacter freundii]